MAVESKFKKEALLVLKQIKTGIYGSSLPFNIPVYSGEEKVALLVPLTDKNLQDSEENRKIVRLLAKWREANSRWFDVFKVTEEGTRKWLKEQVIDCDDRILFLIKALGGSIIGHMGFYRFDFEDHSCELDNVIRGEKNIIPGLMTFVTKTLTDWAFDNLKLRALTLRVFDDNDKAKALYERCGFKKVRDIPLEKVVKGDSIRWVEITGKEPKNIDRYFSQYRIINNNEFKK